jgi:hypothetical protein
MATWHLLSAKVGINFANKQRSISIVRSRTQAMGFNLNVRNIHMNNNLRTD